MNENTLQDKDQHAMGLGMPLFIRGFQDVLKKTSGKQVDCFLAKFDEKVNHKWILSSDYTIHDNNKEADVLAFSLIPYVLSINNFISIIQKLAPQDLKFTATIDPRFEIFLRCFPILHFSVILPKGFTYMNANMGAHATVKSFVCNYCKMLAHWETTTPQAAGRFSAIRMDLERTLRKLDGPQSKWNSDGGKYVKKIQDIILLASISSTILERIMDSIPTSQVCWMPDRDGMMTWPKSRLREGEIFFEIVCDYLWISFANRNKSSVPSNLTLAVPESSGPVWYDEYIRIPDYIAGTISRIDMKTGCSIERLRGLLENVIADNENLIVVQIDEKSACRVIFSNLRSA